MVSLLICRAVRYLGMAGSRCFQLMAGCSRQPSINGDFRISYVWDNGRVSSARVEPVKPHARLSRTVSDEILRTAQPFIANTVNAANLSHGTGLVQLTIYGPKPSFVQVQQLTIVEPSFAELEIAVERQDTARIRDLVSRFHNVNQRELPSRQTALAIAAAGGYVESMNTLLQSGADPNISDYIGVTPLMNAVTIGSEDGVKLLLKAGANAAAVNANGDSAASLANKLHRRSLLPLLLVRQ